MNAREERGLVIAATNKLIQKGQVWLVPSQSGKGKYTVSPDAASPYCSCPDHEDHGGKCKHLYAVEFTMNRETGRDGMVVETKQITLTEKKIYRQSWPLYNLAQIEERRRFEVLLFDLCKGIVEPPPNKVGRKRTAMADMVFTACLKVYTGFSSRRFGCDLAQAHDAGYVSHKLHPVMVCSFLENKLMTPVLSGLIIQSSLPLKAIETTFAPDSSGFSTSRFTRWFDEKYGVERSGRAWVKAHAICGVKTHIVTAVEIHGQDAGDCPQFAPLVKTTAQSFTVKEAVADKAYLSNANLEQIVDLGGMPYIPFKVNSTPGEPGSVWEKLFHLYSLNREAYMAKYHQRSNIESVFSMLKAKFGDSVRSKTDTAMKNEALCKFVCHNICCLIMSQLELGIDASFWGEAPAVQPLTLVAPVTPIPATAVAVTAVPPAVQPTTAPAPKPYMPFFGA